MGESMLLEVVGLDCEFVDDGLDEVDVAGREKP